MINTSMPRGCVARAHGARQQGGRGKRRTGHRSPVTSHGHGQALRCYSLGDPWWRRFHNATRSLRPAASRIAWPTMLIKTGPSACRTARL